MEPMRRRESSMSEILGAFLDYLDQSVEPGTSHYPWEPRWVGTVLEGELEDLGEWSPGALDLGDRSHRFFEGLGTLLAATSLENIQGFEQNLYKQTLQTCFALGIPEGQWERIRQSCDSHFSATVERVALLGRVLADLLPQWSRADRDIFLRGYGGAFRGELQLQGLSTLDQDWDLLPEMEQAKYTVAIAALYLTELADQQSSAENP